MMGAMKTSQASPPASKREARHEALGLTLDDVTGMYRVMLETRMIGERMMQLNRMGKAAFVGVADGHEAAEGATSLGDFNESLTFAAVHRLPVVFIIENNQYAISTPLRLQMAVADVAERAAGYGMPGAIADGTDVLDVYEKAKQAFDRARRGEGPSLVEVKCYRYR